MKPVLLYTLPRTRATALLMSSTRTIKLNEPFSVSHLCPRQTPDESLVAYTTCEQRITDGQWNNILENINNKDSCTKIHAMDLVTSKRGRIWYQTALENCSHEIYVVVRNRFNLALSYIIARQFGWDSYSEKEPFEFEVTESMIMEVALHFDHFFRFWPTGSKVITAETRPMGDFQPSLSGWPKQNSEQKYKYITNYKWCQSRIFDVIDYYDEEWKNRVGYLAS